MFHPVQKTRPLFGVISIHKCLEAFTQLYPIQHKQFKLFHIRNEEQSSHISIINSIAFLTTNKTVIVPKNSPQQRGKLGYKHKNMIPNQVFISRQNLLLLIYIKSRKNQTIRYQNFTHKQIKHTLKPAYRDREATNS